MHSHACKLLFSLSVLVLGGCDLKRELVGETLPGADSSGGDTTDGNSTDDISVTTTDGPPAGAPDGTPCELGPPEFWEEGSMMPEPGAPIEYGGGPIVTPGPACAGDICLYGAFIQAPNCEVDGECAGDERLTGTCSDGHCDIDPAWGEAQTTCTRLCEVDTDCPVVPGCDEGPVCTAISKLGSLCCEKICACRDEIGAGFVDIIEQECNAGKYCQ